MHRIRSVITSSARTHLNPVQRRWQTSGPKAPGSSNRGDSVASYPAGSALHHKAQRTRGGHNLSDRYHRLERSLRAKEAQRKEVQELEQTALSGGVQAASLVQTPSSVDGNPEGTTPPSGANAGSPTTTRTFRGFAIPQKPDPPADDGTSLRYNPTEPPN